MERNNTGLSFVCAGRLRFAAFGLIFSAALSTTAVASTAAPSRVSTLTHAPETAGLQTQGLLTQDEPVQVRVALKMRNRDGLDQFIEQTRTPGSPAYGARLSSQQFLRDYAPTALQAQAVADYLRLQGFNEIQIAPNRLLVSASGTHRTVQSAFGTTLVHATRNGIAGIANTGNVTVPQDLSGAVLAVLGLQTVQQFHTHFIRASDATRANGVHTLATTGHNPSTFPAIYGASGVPTASSATVAIIAQGSLTQTLTDLGSFERNNGLPSVTTQVIKTGASSTDTSGVDEWNLDSQDIVGMTGGVAQLVFYDANSLSNSELTNAFNQAVSDNTATVVNVSLGECETSAYDDGSMDTDDQILAQAVAQGQTFSVSSGDSGADECGDGGTTPSYPASSPYVVAVGGTTLTTSGTSWSKETVWSDGGGSPSTVESAPSWQTTVTDGARGVPDVAFDADPNSGAIVIVNGSNSQIGGTSLAAPLFAGAWARLQSAHGNSLGFAGPSLYQLPSSVFHDVTSGNNGGYSATAGWDYATGFGSLNVGSASGSLPVN